VPQSTVVTGKCRSLVIHFDSAGSLGGRDPSDFRDPTFFEIADVFFELATKYKCVYSIFVIGRDLLNPEVAARVRDWSQRGHEIANHSFHHLVNLGSLPERVIEDEISRSHELIYRSTGVAPEGFVAPNWSVSRKVLEVLLRLGYRYDTSCFPSLWMSLVNGVLWCTEQDGRQRGAILQRHDMPRSAFWPFRPFILQDKQAAPAADRELVEMPLPVIGGLRIPIWHTAAFFYPPGVFRYLLRRISQWNYFYYIMHPADVFDRQDLRDVPLAAARFARMNVSQRKKKLLLEQSLDIIAADSSLMCLRDMGRRIRLEQASALHHRYSLDDLFPAAKAAADGPGE